jgi:hypothetical protein
MRRMRLISTFLLITVAMPCCSRKNEKIARLVNKIDENPDLLHADITPAAEDLIDIGPDAIPVVLPLVLSEDPMTRLHASRVLYGVTAKMHGFVVGRGWPSDSREQACRALWASLGDFDWDAPEDRRAASVKRWEQWFRSGHRIEEPREKR